MWLWWFFFFFQAEDGIRDVAVTGVQTCALPISVPHGLQQPFGERVAEGHAGRQAAIRRRDDRGRPAVAGGRASRVLPQVDDSVSAAQHRSSVQLKRSAEAWLEVVQVAIERLPAVAAGAGI